jgi:iron complex transport system ATP-binding protein
VRLSAQEVEVAYGSRRALAGVTLDVEPGRLLGVIGPNGSGKSTLVRVLAGLRQPDGGAVRLDDRPLAGIPARERARSIAVVPQETHLAFPLRVRELVRLGRSPYTGGFGWEGAADHRIVDEAMVRAEVSALADRRVDELSGGERQRAVVARALAQEPRVLLLDEPTASLDLRHAVVLLDLLRDLARDRGLAIAVVLHDLNLAAMYCDRLALLSEGRLHAVGPPSEILEYEDLCAVYGTELYVAPNDVTGQMVVLPLAREHREQLARRFPHRDPRSGRQ